MALSQETWPRKRKVEHEGQGATAVNAVSPLIRTVAEVKMKQHHLKEMVRPKKYCRRLKHITKAQGVEGPTLSRYTAHK